MARILRSLVVSLIVVGLCLLSPGPRVMFMAHAQESQLREASLDAYMDLIQEFRDAIDRRVFDVDALSFDLAFEDPQTIAAFVRDTIAFEQYSGLLRGAEGTLMSRAGNALDQSVLLAVLLGDAGYEARIVESRLSKFTAAGLVHSVKERTRTDVAIGDVDSMRRIVADLAEMAGSDPQRAVAEFQDAILSDAPDDVAGKAEAATESAFLLDMIGTRPESSDQFERIVVEAQEYFFVEARVSPSDQWRAFHPAFSRDIDLDPSEVVPIEVFSSSIPERLQHRVRFQVFNERLVGSELQTAPVMSAWERPIANLSGGLISYANLPDGVARPEDLGSVEDALTSTAFFFPRFNGGVPSGAVAFDLAGNHVPPDVAQSAAAGVFKAVSDSMNRAAGAIGGLGGDEDAPRAAMSLVGQYAEITLISPGAQERTHVRRVFDLVDPESRRTGTPELLHGAESLDAAVGLVHEFAILVTGATAPPGFVLDRVLEEVLAARPVFSEIQTASFDNKEMWSQLDASPSSLLHWNLLAGFDAFRPLDVVLYRSGPTVLSLETGIFRSADGASAQIQVDVVANERRAFDAADGAFRRDAVVQAGVWETYAEQLDLGDLDIRSHSAFETLQQARNDGQEFLVLDSTDVDSLSDVLTWDADTLHELEADLVAGSLAIVPLDMAREEGTSRAWWLVDGQTGQTVGVTETGRGGETLEALIILGYAFVVVFAACSLVIAAVNVSLNGLWHKTVAEIDPNDVATPRQIGFCAVGGILGVIAGTVGLVIASWIPIVTWAIGMLLGGLNTLFTPPSWSIVPPPRSPALTTRARARGLRRSVHPTEARARMRRYAVRQAADAC